MPEEPQSGTPFRWRDVALTAYGPAVVSSVGFGAVIPVLALRARELGADVGTAALVVALVSLGMLVASLPAGAVVARVGERRTLVVGGVLDAGAMACAALAGSVLALGAAVLVSGVAWTAFLIARQGYLIDVVPESHRARAMSLMGGAFRVGVLIGPLLGAVLIEVAGLAAVFWLAAALSLVAAAMALLMPGPGDDGRELAAAAPPLRVLAVLREHRRVLLTLGSAVVVISASRSLRPALLPLWAEHVGISASTTSLVFAFAAAVDIALAFPGGMLMDRRGRAVVAVPVVLSTAVALMLLPLAHSVVAFAAVAALIAAGNGLGSGIVMTLGADSAPTDGRAQFLGGWRLSGDIGNTGGPLLLAAVVAVAPLATASMAVGALALLGTLWVARWTRDADRRRAAALSRP